VEEAFGELALAQRRSEALRATRAAKRATFNIRFVARFDDGSKKCGRRSEGPSITRSTRCQCVFKIREGNGNPQVSPEALQATKSGEI